MSNIGRGVCMCGLMVVIGGCKGRDSGYWRVAAEEIVLDEEIYVTSVRVTGERDGRLEITEDGQARDGVQVTGANGNACEGKLVVCAYRVAEVGRTKRIKVWYVLESNGVRSLSADVMVADGDQRLAGVVAVRAVDGPHRSGDAVARISLGGRKFTLWVR